MNIRQLAQQIVADPAYSDSLLQRARTGTLPPGVEELLIEMADGRTAPAPLVDESTAPAAAPSPVLAFARRAAAHSDGD